MLLVSVACPTDTDTCPTTAYPHFRHQRRSTPPPTRVCRHARASRGLLLAAPRRRQAAVSAMRRRLGLQHSDQCCRLYPITTRQAAVSAKRRGHRGHRGARRAPGPASPAGCLPSCPGATGRNRTASSALRPRGCPGRGRGWLHPTGVSVMDHPAGRPDISGRHGLVSLQRAWPDMW